MSQLSDVAPHWAGHLFGTNTGKLHLALGDASDDGASRVGLLRVSDDNLGVSTYTVTLSQANQIIEIRGKPEVEVEGIEQGDIEAKATFDAKGSLHGDWKSSIGTGGVFDLYPHLGTSPRQSAPALEQIYTSNRDLGALRLYRSDLSEILSVLRRKFPASRVVVTHIDRGAELALFDDQFEKRLPSLERLDWIKLSVSAPAEDGLTKSLTIDLGQSFNRVTAQGPDESWVLGEVEATASTLRRRQQRFSTAIGKHKVNFNFLIFLGALVAMPDLALQERAIFIAGVVALLLFANKATNILVPNFRMDVQNERPNFFKHVWPSTLSWLISVSSAIAASFLFDWLK